MENSNMVGVLIEDAYISAGLVNLEDRRVAANTLRRKRVNPGATGEEIISVWATVIKELLELNNERNAYLGIGIPEQFIPESGIFLGTNPERYGSLYRRSITELLAEKLNIPRGNIRLINDAASFFQGEVFAGAVRGFKQSFGITLGVGLGSARYLNGKVEDANFWKLPFKDSIAEEYLSVKWLVKRFQQLSGIEVLDLVEMKRFAPDSRVDQAFEEFGTNLGQFLVEMIKRENPQVILIGGHMESSNRFFFNTASNYVQSQGFKTPIMKAILGEKASLIGAASVWYENSLHT